MIDECATHKKPLLKLYLAVHFKTKKKDLFHVADSLNFVFFLCLMNE